MSPTSAMARTVQPVMHVRAPQCRQSTEVVRAQAAVLLVSLSTLFGDRGVSLIALLAAAHPRDCVNAANAIVLLFSQEPIVERLAFQLKHMVLRFYPPASNPDCRKKYSFFASFCDSVQLRKTLPVLRPKTDYDALMHLEVRIAGLLAAFASAITEEMVVVNVVYFVPI